MKQLFDDISKKSSKLVTKTYSTSFSLGIRFLARKFHNPIYAVYGFVRFADEIVDSFHGYDKRTLLEEFKHDTYKAIENGISLNPILNNFAQVVNQFQIDPWTIETFFKSMEMDLDLHTYDQDGYEEYILGSAEVVGLMCLKVFVEGDEEEYNRLKHYAMKLGSAFQKIYFPQLRNGGSFDRKTKKEIEADILKDFNLGYEGIKKLPKNARFGVYVAYIYYSQLLNKIVDMPPKALFEERIRISDKKKYALFFGSYLRHSFNLL